LILSVETPSLGGKHDHDPLHDSWKLVNERDTPNKSDTAKSYWDGTPSIGEAGVYSSLFILDHHFPVTQFLWTTNDFYTSFRRAPRVAQGVHTHESIMRRCTHIWQHPTKVFPILSRKDDEGCWVRVSSGDSW